MNRNDLPSPNAICAICGHEYRKCKRCIELKRRGVYAWKLYCDTVQCYEVWKLLHDTPENLTEKQLKEISVVKLPEGRELCDATKKTISNLLKSIKAKEKLSIPHIKSNTSKAKSQDK